MNRRALSLCAALALGLPAAAGELKGRLLVDGKPAKGVTVAAVPFESPLEQARREARFQEPPKELASVKSGADGGFALVLLGPALAAGTNVSLTFTGGGVSGARLGVYDAGGSEDVGEVRLFAAAALAGKVLDEKGKPVAGATLTLWPGLWGRLDPLPVAAATAPDGTFRFDQATERGNALRIEAPGQAVVALSGVKAGALREAVRLAPGRAIDGTVQRADKRTPAAGALVRFEGKLDSRWVEAGPNGVFRLTGLPLGTGTLAADAGDLGQARAPLAPGQARITLVLAPTAAVAGRVVDTGNGKPIAGIRVVARSRGTLFTARSGPDGRYTLRGLPGGSLDLRADDARYASWRADGLGVTAGETLVRDVLLKPGATLQGRVLDENGAPIEGARIAVAGAADSDFPGRMRRMLMGLASDAQARSAADGAFSAARLPAGSGQTLTVTHLEHEPRTIGGLTLKPGSANPKVTVVLRRGLGLRGVVKDALGKPVADAEVELSRSFAFQSGRGGRTRVFGFSGGPDSRPKKTTGPDGTFRFEGLLDGDYTLTARKPGYARVRVDPVKVADGPAAEPLLVTLQIGSAISGFVRDKSGKGLEGVHVMARVPGAGRTSGAEQIAEEGSRPDGAFLIDGLAAGTAYDLQVVTSSGPDGARKSGVVAPAEEVELSSAGVGSISGTALDADGVRPVTDFEVTYTPAESGGMRTRMVIRGVNLGGGPGEVRSVHAEDGQFTIADVSAGKWDVVVKAAGYQPGRVAAVQVEADTATSGVEVRLSRGATIGGRVLEAGTGKPILDAAVRARVQGTNDFGMMDDSQDLGAQSDADGRFEIKGLGPGTYVVTASHSDWTEATQSVALKDLPAAVDLRMSKGGSLGGTVLSGGRPLAGASVALSASGEDFGPRRGGDGQVSDAAGRFRFEHLLPGRYNLSAALRSESSAPVEVVLQQGQSRDDVQISVGGGALVHGRVVGLPDDQLGGVMVNASGAESYGASARSGTDGAFELLGVPAGALTVRAMAGDWSTGTRSATAQVVIGENQPEASVEVRFEAGLRLQGHVTRAGQPLAEVSVRAYPEGQGGRGASARTDETGFYALEGLSEGDHVVNASGGASGATEAHVQKRVTLNGDTTLDLEAPAARLAGRVVEAETQRPLAEASVQLGLGPRAGFGTVATDSNGRFAFESLEPRSYPVSVQKPAFRTEAREVLASEDSDLVIELHRGEGIGILAHDGIYGTPLRALMVRVLNAQGLAVYTSSVSLDGEGRGEIPSLQPGVYELRAGASDYAPVLLRGVAVPAPQLALTLTPGGTLEIKSGAETQALPNAQAQLLTADGQVYALSIFGGGNIALNVPVRRLEYVALGRYTLVVQGGPTRSVEVREGETAVVNLP